MARAKAKADQRAATRGGGFTGLPHAVQDSAAYRHLSLFGRAVLLEVLRRFNGYNNGKIAISFDDLADRLNTTNRRAIGKAFVELVQHGLLDVTAAPDRKHHKAREYRLTFVSTGDGARHVQATDDYREWQPPAQNHGDDVSPRKGVHGDDVSPRRAIHGDDVSLRIANYRRKTVERQPIHGDDVSLHISKPYPPGAIDGAKGGIGEPTTASAPRFVSETEEQKMERTTATVKAALIARRSARGLVGLSQLASAAGVEFNRLNAFLDNRDTLYAPQVLRLREQLVRSGALMGEAA